MLLAERRRRQARADDSARRARANELLADAHPKQYACITDAAPQVGALCTRRSGKSRGWLRRMSADAATVPGCRQVYVNTTFPECEQVAWFGNKRADGLLGINEEFNLGGKPNSTKMRIEYPGDSFIRIVAAADDRAIQKLLGGAYHRVVIDEAQKMPHLDRFIKEILVPAMMDFGGQIVLIGTPARECSGLFYEITREDADPAVSGPWSVHRWSVLDNPFFGDTPEERWERSGAKAAAQTGLTMDSPEMQREWFGRWVKSDANYVYAVHQVLEDDLCYDGRLPTREDGSSFDWFYGVGVDLGYSPDPFAYVVWAWCYESPVLYEVESFKQTELTPDEQGEIIQRLLGEYNPSFVVGDAGGGGKAIVAGWAKGWEDRFPIPIQEAKKNQKPTYIEFLNNDIRTGKVKLLRGGSLHKEMRDLTWLPKTATGYLKEDKRHPNHCADAALYAHREAQHHRFIPEEPEPEPGTPEWHQKEAERLEQEVLDRLAEEEEFLDGF